MKVIGSRSFILVLVIFGLLAWSVPGSFSRATAAQTEKGDTFLYADFEKQENGRAVSNHGGMIQIYAVQESTPVSFKGLPNTSPAAPEVVKIKPDDPNHLATFDYSLRGPNQWANVTMQVLGHPYENGKPVADDVSTYKYLSLQLYVTGVPYVTVELASQGQGLKINSGFPQASIKIQPNLNTYRIPLKSLTQPSWVQDKVDTKAVLQKLTAVNITVGCNQCLPVNGTVVVDNLVFQK